MCGAECRRCGCALERTDVRQLALYYRQERNSLVVVQYQCPHCGATEWQEYDPALWHGEAEAPASPRNFDWPALAAGIDRAGRAGCATEQEPISLDEYIDFGQRLARLDPADLAALRS